VKGNGRRKGGGRAARRKRKQQERTNIGARTPPAAAWRRAGQGGGAHGERELKELSKTEWDLGGMTNDGSKKQVSSLEVMEAESPLAAEV
jgi:hypothetical protein